jgi:hypothetical protein
MEERIRTDDEPDKRFQDLLRGEWCERVVGQTAAGVVALTIWLPVSFLWWYNLILVPLGCVIVVGLVVARVRGARVGTLLVFAVLATSWSGMIVGSIWVWGPRNPEPNVGPPPLGELSADQQMSVDKANLEFFDVAYRVRDLEQYRHHVIGRPDPEQLAGCWDGTPVRALPSVLERGLRDASDPHSVIDVYLAYGVADVGYRARLEVTADDWQVVELDRVPGFEHCPMGFPLPPAPPPAGG